MIIHKKSKKKLNFRKSKKKLISPNEFRESTYFEDMIDKYKQKKINNREITDKDILEYINKMSNDDKILLMKDITEIKKYKKLKNKINFQPITIELLRKNYWNSKTKKWKPIKSYYGDSGNPNDIRYGPNNITNIQDRNNREKIFCDEFIPNGDLEESNFDWSTGKGKIHKKWLQSEKLGPYKYEDYDYKNKKKLFYLDGKMKYCGDNQYEEGDGMQICKGNYVSNNCAGGPNWIEVDKKNYV